MVGAGEGLADRPLTALELAAQVRACEVSPAELVEATVRRAETENARLNFLVTDCYLQALETARGPLPDGPFAGVPMLVKDLTETAGLRTTFSSRAFAGYVPAADAAIVRRMKEAGFVVIGKSNTPEFGITCVTESDLNGACRNPYDLARTPGGSSGGAAAAVAAGVLPLAHGSDGGGSLRIPASCCGLFGIKPSRGRVSPAPYVSGSLELSQSGPLATSVRDAAEALAALGHEVVEATPPWQGDDLLDLFAFLWQLTPALYPVQDEGVLIPLNRFLAERARATSSVAFAQAVGALQRLARRVVAFWDDVDVVLTPGLAKLPVPLGWVFEPDDPWEQFVRGAEFTPFTPVVNVTGQPAATVPFATVDGLPVGVQLIGRPADEATLFRLAAQLEAAYP